MNTNDWRCKVRLRNLIRMLLASVYLVATGEAAEIAVVDGRYEGEKYVSISGLIAEGDLERTLEAARVASTTGRNTLAFLLDSPGGDVEEALKLGRLIRQLMGTTYVYGNQLYTPGTPTGDDIESFGEDFSQVRFHVVPIEAGVSLAEADVVRCREHRPLEAATQRHHRGEVLDAERGVRNGGVEPTPMPTHSSNTG